MLQSADVIANAELDGAETAAGTSPYLRLYNGTIPANCAASLSGNTLLAEGTLPSDWLGNAASRVKSKAGTWTVTGQSGAGAGTQATFFRIYKSDGTTCIYQGKVGTNFTLATSAATTAHGNVLTFTATTGAAVGQTVSGTGIPAGAFVESVTSTTVTLSLTSTAGVSSTTSITFGFDMSADNVYIANSQVITVNSFSLTAGNA